MTFNIKKTELVYFTRSRKQPTSQVYLSGTAVLPKASARFLGVWLDRKLQWKAHLKEIRIKLAKQELALSRLTGKTWGYSLVKAREIYTKVIRSAIAYGATSFHKPTEEGGKPKGIAIELAKDQTRSLKIVTGGYKATPSRLLETECWVPPIDLYLNKRRADYEERLERTGMAEKIRQSMKEIGTRLRNRKTRLLSSSSSYHLPKPVKVTG